MITTKFNEKEFVYCFDPEECEAGSHVTIRHGIIGKSFRVIKKPSGIETFYEVIVNLRLVGDQMILLRPELHAISNKKIAPQIETMWVSEKDMFRDREDAEKEVEKYITLERPERHTHKLTEA